MKKRMSLAVSSSKQIMNGLPETYTTNRRRLENLERNLRKAVELSTAGECKWASILKIRRDISECIRMACEDDGVLGSEVTTTLASLDTTVEEIDDFHREEARQSEIMTGIQAYLTEIESVKKSFHEVDTAFHEVVRYGNKIEKLKMMKKKKVDKVQNNLSKLTAARAKYQAKLNCVTAMIAATMGKRDAFLQSAFYMFWINENCYEMPMCRHSKNIRETAYNRRSRLSLLKVGDANARPISD